MSWKATAFVKELRENLIVTEKFVLLMLAEYHRTDDKLSWPSVSTLAYDCLMEERSVRRILARLEEAKFIRRQAGGGRGNVTAYQIAGLDYQNPVSKSGLVASVNPDTESVIPESVFGETLIADTLNPDTNPDRGSQCNKEARGCTGERDNPVTEESFTLDAATRFVMVESGFAGRGIREIVHQVLYREIKKVGVQPKAVAEVLIAAWKRYSSMDLTFEQSPENFFGRGTWRTETKWKEKQNGSANRAEQTQTTLLDARTEARRAVGLDH